jgi:hypothetical protein
MTQPNIRCIAHISSYSNPQLFHEILAELDETRPGCPHNVAAAETLSKPQERRGWQQCYVDAVENWQGNQE